MSSELETLIELDSPRRFLTEKVGYLMKTYPDKYVAIADGAVVFAESDLNKLLKQVREKYGDLSKVLIDYIPAKQGHTFF